MFCGDYDDIMRLFSLNYDMNVPIREFMFLIGSLMTEEFASWKSEGE